VKVRVLSSAPHKYPEHCLPSASDLGSLVQDDCRRVGVDTPHLSTWQGASAGNALRTLRTLELLNPLLQHRTHTRRGWVPEGRERLAPDQERSDEEIWAEIHAITPAQAPERTTCLVTTGLQQMLDGLRGAAPATGEGQCLRAWVIPADRCYWTFHTETVISLNDSCRITQTRQNSSSHTRRTTLRHPPRPQIAHGWDWHFPSHRP